MRTISLRSFKNSIPDFTEQVTVQRRTASGDIETLGIWSPSSASKIVDRPATPAPKGGRK